MIRVIRNGNLIREIMNQISIDELFTICFQKNMVKIYIYIEIMGILQLYSIQNDEEEDDVILAGYKNKSKLLKKSVFLLKLLLKNKL